MVRRSTPQYKIDDAAFPIRVLIRQPPGGLGKTYLDLLDWLEDRLGRINFAVHGSAAATRRDGLAVYLRRPADAIAMVEAFPTLVLADGTTECWYTSPYLPFGRPPEDEPICNRYRQTTTQAAMRGLFSGLSFHDRAGNIEPGEVYPDRMAPIIRHDGEALELVKARWGMPSPTAVLKTARDPGVTNIRNVASPHWRRWLGPAHRCLVPLTAFAEPRGAGPGDQWFAAADGGPMFFAGVELRGWTSVRKVKDGPTTDDLFAFLTTEPNAEVGAIHPKAMPVILTTREAWETWLSAPWEVARQMHRPLPDGALSLLAEQPME